MLVTSGLAYIVTSPTTALVLRRLASPSPWVRIRACVNVIMIFIPTDPHLWPGDPAARLHHVRARAPAGAPRQPRPHHAGARPAGRGAQHVLSRWQMKDEYQIY